MKTTKELAQTVATVTGMKPLCARQLTGSMRGYFETAFRFDGTQNELRILLSQMLGFQPFFVQSNFDGTFQVNMDIDRLCALKPVLVIPISDLYADLLTAVNRGDLPAAKQLAAQIAA